MQRLELRHLPPGLLCSRAGREVPTDGQLRYLAGKLLETQTIFHLETAEHSQLGQL